MIHNSLVIYMNAHGFGEADVCTQKNLDPAMQRIHHPRQHQHLHADIQRSPAVKTMAHSYLLQTKSTFLRGKHPLKKNDHFPPSLHPTERSIRY